MRFLILLLLVSCGPQLTKEELESNYMDCINERSNCKKERFALEARERRLNRHKECNICPNGLIDIHNDWGHAGCMSRDELAEIFW